MKYNTVGCKRKKCICLVVTKNCHPYLKLSKIQPLCYFRCRCVTRSHCRCVTRSHCLRSFECTNSLIAKIYGYPDENERKNIKTLTERRRRAKQDRRMKMFLSLPQMCNWLQLCSIQ